MSNPRCPDCGSSFAIDPKCVIDEPYFPRPMYRDQSLPRRNRVAPVAFCTGCEFTIEIVYIPPTQIVLTTQLLNG